jgi:hypothetical protein
MTESDVQQARAKQDRATRLEELEAEAQHARQVYDLYKAKTYGPRPTSPGQLRGLERACSYAEARLGRAQRRIKQLN